MTEQIEFIDLKAQQEKLGSGLSDAIARVLRHGRYIMGPEVAEFEQELSAFCGADHVVTCANGTDALVLVLMAEDIGPGDAVFVPSFTFIATAEAVAARRATPVFVDVDPRTFNIDAESLERAISAAKDDGLKPRMVIAVDLFGQPADYATLRKCADAHGLILVADAAQSFGAQSNEGKVGTLADYTTTSFFPAKPLGCFGDGGAVTTEDRDAATMLRSLRLHGSGSDKYENVRVGLNSRLDTLQAAILLEKLKIFPDEIDARNVAAHRYRELLSDIVVTPALSNNATSVWAQYTIVLDSEAERSAVQTSCKSAGVPTAIYYPIPLHVQKGYSHFPADPEGLQNSETLSSRVLSLPMHGYLDEAVQTRVADAVRAGLRL